MSWRKKWLKVANAWRGKKVAKKSGVARVAIVSCDRWKNKVYDDLLLQREFLRRGMAAEIVSWQDAAVNWQDFAVAVVGSMWGYQDFLGDFERWLGRIEQATTLINPAAVIRANYDKAEQFGRLEQAGIPTIMTQVIGIGELERWEQVALATGEFVIKPAISGSGENTFLIKNEDDLEKVRDKLVRLNQEKALLVQPFVPEIRAGELGIVMIGGEIMNVVRRFPGVLTGNYCVQAVAQAEISREIKELIWKIRGLAEYREATYLRIDVVERTSGPVVMEVEAFEPQLYYYLLRGAERRRMLARMVAEVVKKARV